VVNRWEKADPRDDGRERVARARQAAEALFTTKRPVAEQSVSDSPPSAGKSARKPRVLGIASTAPARHELAEPPVTYEQRSASEIPAAQFARIRSWVKYGMTPAQVAQVYGVKVGEIDRIVRDG
jgi:hypothetical protein